MTTPTTTSPPPLSPNQAATKVAEEAQGALPVYSIHFIPITQYTTFRAEVAVSDGDLIFHFFVNDEIKARSDAQQYWTDLFPTVLSQVATEHFAVDYPRLKAAYTEEQASWWMRAYGFGQLLEAHKFAYVFFDKLDAALDAASSTTT